MIFFFLIMRFKFYPLLNRSNYYVIQFDIFYILYVYNIRAGLISIHIIPAIVFSRPVFIICTRKVPMINIIIVLYNIPT